ncbi:unnamed protein product [marine sediment metagenome]|uniref:Uncharacterized protein n=1 Tax=marine sediment metagenome TaxID=412755 RepID=X0TNT3_9ZZZZ
MEANVATLKSIIDGGEMVLLALVLAGGWRLLKPAVDGWLEQYQQLLKVVLELTTSLALINANLKQTVEVQKELTKGLDSHESKAELRHHEIMRGLKGKLGHDPAD